ncbi:MAG: SpoIID/LytB domain protein [Clostridiales bacterium]|nr:SpoIID/LytB domain protein [Clostridiales bacterium]
MKNPRFSGLLYVSALFLIPYLAAVLFQGSAAVFSIRGADMEEFLPLLTSGQMEEDYEAAALEAQSVIARSNLCYRLGEGESLPDILKEIWDCGGISFWRLWNGSLNLEEYREAAAATAGKVLTWQGELKYVPYHEVSAGQTRDGAEAFHDEAYTYLQSVESSGDRNAPDYLSTIYVSSDWMPGELTVAFRDSAGYVTALTAGGNLLEGEAFRLGIGLASADFTVEMSEGQFCFVCKGKGHGLGFSQYGGNVLAENGYTWEEILEVYFPVMEICDTEEVT